MPGSAADRGRSAITWGLAAHIGVTLLLLLPIWVPTYFPTLDGPAHLHVAEAWLDLGSVNFDARAEYYQRLEGIHANYLIYPVLWSLLQVVDPFLSEKILITIYIIAFASAAYYFSSSLRKEGDRFAFLFLPLIFPAVLALGFFNHAFGMAVFLAFLGFWWCRRERVSASTILGYLALGCLAYATHLIALVMIGFAIATLTISWMVKMLALPRCRSLRSILMGLVSRALVPALVTLPLLVIGLRVAGQEDAFRAGAGGFAFEWPTLQKVMILLGGWSITGHDQREAVVAASFVGLLLILAIALFRADGRRARRSPFLTLAGATTVLYMVLPNEFLIDWVTLRMAPYVYLTWVAWLIHAMPAGISPLSERPRPLRPAIVASAIAAIVVAGTALRTLRAVEIDSFIGEYVSVGDHMASGSSMLALRLDYPEAEALSRADLFLQMVGYIAVETGGIDLKNWQIHTGMFPVRYRDGMDPYHVLASDTQFIAYPETIRPTDYHAATGHPVDYVLLWGEAESLPPDSVLAADLAAHYELIHVSEPRGAMRLFRLAD